MSLLLRVRLSSQNRFSALQHLNFYSEKTGDVAQEAVKSTNFRTQKSSESSPNYSQRRKEQSTASTIWPKPREIPYQAKVANLVNLVGYVETPVHSEAASDGKHFAVIVISQKSIDRKGSLSIPVVFDGDLAHVVTHHVKQNDCVFVSGRLSEEPLKLPLGSSFGKLSVVAENINFVEGFKRNVSYKKIEVSFTDPEKIELYEKVEDFSRVKNDWVPSGKGGYKKKDEELWKDLVKNPLQWWDFRSHKSNGLVKDKYPDFKRKWNGESLWTNCAPEWVLTELGKLEFDVKVMQRKEVQGCENSKRDDLWKNLVENPSMWWDNRLGKRNPRSPDFKHKETGEGVWLDQLPDWALSRLPPSIDGQTAGKAF